MTKTGIGAILAGDDDKKTALGAPLMTGVGAFPHRPRRTFQGAIADRLDGAYATMSAAGPVNGPWNVRDGGYGQVPMLPLKTI